MSTSFKDLTRSFIGRVAPKALSARRWVIAALVSMTAIAGVLWWSTPSDVTRVLAAADLGWVGAGLIWMVVVVCCRFVRLWFWLPEHQRTWRLFGVVNGHGILNQILPFRTGELVFPMLLRRATGRPYAVGLADLLVFRVMELLVLAVCVFVAWLSWFTPSGALSFLRSSIPMIPAVAICAIVAAVILLVSRPTLWKRIRVILISRTPSGIPGRFLPTLLEAYAERTWTRLGMVVMATVAMWLALFGVYFCALSSCGVVASWPETVLGSLGAVFANLLPVNGVGSVGTMEVGWVAGFVALGKEPSEALAAGIVLHASIVGVLAVMSSFTLLPSPRAGAPESHR